MRLESSSLDRAERVLDVGGWFAPESRATHVVDLLPWETRGGRLQLESAPGERFTRDTWHQVDFLAPGFRLPFPDGSFDLVVCADTLEDLTDPRPLLAEMDRVGRAGIVAGPSRLEEQTVGIRDRETGAVGQPHHHWILDPGDGVLRLFAKADSGLEDPRRTVPLAVMEALRTAAPSRARCYHEWEGRLRHEVVTGPACARAAEAFVAGLGVSPFRRADDALRRALRRVRTRLAGGPRPDEAKWWRAMLELSRPYDRLADTAGTGDR